MIFAHLTTAHHLESALAYLHREWLRAAQAVDSAQENLDLAEGHGRLVLWNHVARELNGSVGQPTLGVGRAHDTRSCKSAVRVVGVGRDDKVVARGGLEALEASPGGVLNLKDGAIRDENHVKKTVRDNDVLGPLNHSWQDGES